MAKEDGMNEDPRSILDLTREEVRQLTAQDEECTPDVIRIAPVWPVAGSSGVTITDEGVVVVDTGIPAGGPDRVRRIRERTDIPFHTIIYTHGHGDHAGGAGAFLEDAEKRGHPKPRIIAHELVPKRFDKYQMLQGRRQYIGSLQFPGRQRPAAPAGGQAGQPPRYYYPDITYSDEIEITLGGKRVNLAWVGEINHSSDTSLITFPDDDVMLIVDYVSGRLPNREMDFELGRFEEWITAIRVTEEQAQDFEFVATGHGPVGTWEVVTAWREYLEKLQDEVTAGIAAGQTLAEMQRDIKMEEYSGWEGFDWIDENVLGMYHFLTD